MPRPDGENEVIYLKYPYSAGSAWITHYHVTALRRPRSFLDYMNVHFLTAYLEIVKDIKCPETMQIFEPPFLDMMRKKDFIIRNILYKIRWEAELLIFKMLEHKHAFIFVIDIQKWTLYIIDSLEHRQFHTDALKTVSEYMEAAYQTKNGSDRKLTQEILKVDQQLEDSYDCILHVAGYLEYLIRDSSDGFKTRVIAQTNMSAKFSRSVTNEVKIFYTNQYVKKRQEVLDLLLQEKSKLMMLYNGDKNDNSLEIKDDEVLKRKQCIITDDRNPNIKFGTQERVFKHPKRHAKHILKNKLKKIALVSHDSLRKGMLFQCNLCCLDGRKGKLHKSVYSDNLLEHDINWLNENNLFYISELKYHVTKHDKFTSDSYREKFGDPVKPDYAYFHQCHLCSKVIELTNDKLKNHAKFHNMLGSVYMETHCYPMSSKKDVSYGNKKNSKCIQCIEMFAKVKNNICSK